LCGGVHRYAAQENSQIDTARAEKGTFRMETNWAKTKFGVGSEPGRAKVIVNSTF